MSSKAYKEAKASYEIVKDLAKKAARAAAREGRGHGGRRKQIADLEGRWKELQGQAEAAAQKAQADQKAAWDTDAKGRDRGPRGRQGRGRRRCRRCERRSWRPSPPSSTSGRPILPPRRARQGRERSPRLTK